MKVIEQTRDRAIILWANEKYLIKNIEDYMGGMCDACSVHLLNEDGTIDYLNCNCYDIGVSFLVEEAKKGNFTEYLETMPVEMDSSEE